MSLKHSKIQSLLFPKDKFTSDSAMAWAESHHFFSKFGNKKQPDITEDYVRLRQKNPSKKDNVHFATVDFGESGIKAVIEYKTDDFKAKGHSKKK